MLFKTVEDLLAFVNNHEQELLEMLLQTSSEKLLESFKELSEAAVAKKCKCDEECDPCKCGEECKCEDGCAVKEEAIEATVSSSGSIMVESLSGDPTFKLTINEEDESVFYVKDYVATENVCGTGSITLNDRTSHMNMCESDNIAKVTLTVVVEGKRITGVPFILSRTEKDPHIVLSKVHLL